MGIDRATKRESLRVIRNLGFMPQVVFDVGAQIGTTELYEVFPESTHVLIEPVKENEEKLKEVCKSIRHATYIIAAADKKSGRGNLKITRNHQYSGLVRDLVLNDSTSHFHREVETVAIDDLVRNANLPGPFLLKIDVDGAEINVLEGAKEALTRTGVAVIESTLFGQIHDVIDFMQKSGFVVYDILEPLYRPLDGALWQVDLVFIPKDSPLRVSCEYASSEQMKVLHGA